MAKKELVAGTQSKWDGRLLTLIGTELLMFLVVAIFSAAGAGAAYALGAFAENAEPLMLGIGIAIMAVLELIGFCWAVIIYLKWYTRHIVVSGQRMKFTANTWNLFWNVIKWIFLTVITVGIYGLWMPIKLAKWQFAHTVSEPEVDESGYVQQPEVNYYYDDEY